MGRYKSLLNLGGGVALRRLERQGAFRLLACLRLECHLLSVRRFPSLASPLLAPSRLHRPQMF
ncbi:hypothetical protein CyaNS01_00467 [Cyanobium sp. NS01]|nr:hypothetical protein CyaNS01_00467 [Cyanobium sp. NS01]